jgi:hypothetical protein
MDKRFKVTLTFTTRSGVRVQRAVTLRDQFARNAEARALATAVPTGASNATASAVKVA